jgi:hypothetical protein
MIEKISFSNNHLEARSSISLPEHTIKVPQNSCVKRIAALQVLGTY